MQISVLTGPSQISNSEDQGPRKDNVAQKKPILRYMSREREKRMVTSLPFLTFKFPVAFPSSTERAFKKIYQKGN